MMNRMELPPRTRRIPPEKWLACHSPGTTSAYAENTTEGYSEPPFRWNYLRVRGEYCNDCVKNEDCVELPPRTRRIRPGGRDVCGGTGTTSAYAENTP